MSHLLLAFGFKLLANKKASHREAFYMMPSRGLEPRTN